MKKVLVFAMVALMLLGFTSFASAAGGEIGLKGGYAAGTGDFGDANDGAFAYGIFGEYGFSEMFAAQVALTRHVHEGVDLPDGVRSDFSINALTLNGKVYFRPEGVRPYLSAGVGAYFWDYDFRSDLVNASYTDDNADFGVNGGGGIAFDVNPKVTLGVEVLYHYLTGDEWEDSGYVDVLGTISYGF